LFRKNQKDLFKQRRKLITKSNPRPTRHTNIFRVRSKNVTVKQPLAKNVQKLDNKGGRKVVNKVKIVSKEVK
jgi:hypothetical protein